MARTAPRVETTMRTYGSVIVDGERPVRVQVNHLAHSMDHHRVFRIHQRVGWKEHVHLVRDGRERVECGQKCRIDVQFCFHLCRGARELRWLGSLRVKGLSSLLYGTSTDVIGMTAVVLR